MPFLTYFLTCFDPCVLLLEASTALFVLSHIRSLLSFSPSSLICFHCLLSSASRGALSLFFSSFSLPSFSDLSSSRQTVSPRRKQSFAPFSPCQDEMHGLVRRRAWAHTRRAWAHTRTRTLAAQGEHDVHTHTQTHRNPHIRTSQNPHIRTSQDATRTHTHPTTQPQPHARTHTHAHTYAISNHTDKSALFPVARAGGRTSLRVTSSTLHT
eukprot:5305786-Pleurochrysis_carterae.AAC.1